MAKTTRIKKIFSNLKHLLPLIIGIFFLVYASILGVYTYRDYVQRQIQQLITDHEKVINQYNMYANQFESAKNTFLASDSTSLLQNTMDLSDFDSLNQREVTLSDQALMISTAMSNYDKTYLSLKLEDQKRSDIYKVYTSLIDDNYKYLDYQTLESKIYGCFSKISLSTNNNKLTSNIKSCTQYKDEMSSSLTDLGRANLSNTNDYWNNYFDYWNYINTVYTSKDSKAVLKLEKTINDKYRALSQKKILADKELQYNFRGKYLAIISSF